MVGEAGALERRIHSIGNHEILRIRPVVGHIALVRLAQREIVAIDVAVQDEIEAVHAVVIGTDKGAIPGVILITWYAVAVMTQRNNLPGGDGSSGCSVDSGIGAEHIVEGAVFFYDEDDVLDVTEAAHEFRRRAGLAGVGAGTSWSRRSYYIKIGGVIS